MFKLRGDVEEKGKRALTDLQQTESCTGSDPRLSGAWNGSVWHRPRSKTGM